MLSGNKIKSEIEANRIQVMPFMDDMINPGSINVTLHDVLLVPERRILDAAIDNKFESMTIPAEGFQLQPDTLYLGRTREWVHAPYHVPIYDGRSSMARLGLFSHITAGFGDRGFQGYFTLELAVVQPLRIYPNMRIGQIRFEEIDGAGPVYQGKYNNSVDPDALPMTSQIWRELAHVRELKPPQGT